MSVDPKFHPKIIGRKGAVISQIRKDHDVNIQFPDKGDEDQVGGCIGFIEYCVGTHREFFREKPRAARTARAATGSLVCV